MPVSTTIRSTFLTRRRLPAGLCLLVLLTAPALRAAQVQVAVAANFLGTTRQLVRVYERHHADRILISSASTGNLYAQISHGAPYDILLAADARRPRLLEQAGLTVPGSRFTYAIGRLVLWSRQAGLITAGATTLKQGRIARLAIANPATAPYGAAAEAVLKHLGLWQQDRAQRVQGENVAQTLLFAVTGNVDAAFVALSQVTNPHHPLGGSRWVVPTAWYPPIEQQAVLLKSAADKPAARAFYAFLRSAQARTLIKHHGYHVPAPTVARKTDSQS